MDPVTQALLGAAAAQAALGTRLRRAWLVGAVGGVIPDLDVLVGSATDPLLAIEYHRQFTHALAFIPVGGAVAALPWLLRRSGRSRWKAVLAAATLGYATHGLLDAFTTYGTQLWWPFSRARVAWDWISIVDPAFTLTLLVGVVWAARRHARAPAAVALALALLYLGMGGVQHARALDAQRQIAAARGHLRERGEVFPTLANQLVWRSLYQSGDSLYADRIRVSWLGARQWTEGSRVALQREADLPAHLRANPRVVRDFRRFRWFSDGWVARAPREPSVFGDVRYSLRSDAFLPIWGVRFHPDRPVPTEWVNRTRDRSLNLRALWAEIVGSSPDYRSLSQAPRAGAVARPALSPHFDR